MDSQTNCKLILQDGPLPGAEFELTAIETVIGRAPTSDIVIAFPAVSGRHALVVRQQGQHYIEDLKSSNGTFLNGQRLSSRQLLNPGAEIRFGQSVILTYQAPVPDKTLVQSSVPDATMLEVDMDGGETMVSPIDDSAEAAVDKVDSGATRAAQDVPGIRPKPEEFAPPGPEESGKTMMYDDFLSSAALAAPQFQVAIAGNPPSTYTLDKSRMTIGRADDNDIVVPSRIVSRHHAHLERVDGGYQLVPHPEAGNPVLFEGRPLSGSHRLGHDNKLRIGGLDPGSLVTMTYISPQEAISTEAASPVQFGEKTQLTFGRDPSNDVVLDTPAISRYHAQVERVGQRYRVRDLRSSNGTFVNGHLIEGDVWLNPNDAIRIGMHRFVMGKDRLAQYDESADLRVEAVDLSKWVRKDLNILQDISVVFQPREFVVVVGQSGGGKSTLVDAISGYRPATHGDVFVNDINVYENFDAIRNDIGYVPQRDIIHMELTVFQALNYAAQLRMPPDTTKEERLQRIEQVLADLDLAHRKDVQISGLSGGQQKRVSIGVELLTKPSLFYLDEPTSGLDPGTETSLMQLMRRLADQGRTIVLITHATKNVMLADKVAFLARGGYLTWFGPPDEALAYFDNYRSERDRRARDIEFDEIYGLLDDPSNGSPQDWGERFKNNPAYNKYISTPLDEKDHAPTGQFRSPTAAQPGPKKQGRQVSSIRQFLIFSSRNIKILTRDRFSLALMLAAPPLVSLLDVILALVLGSDPFNFGKFSSMPNVMITLFLLTVYGVMVGGLAQMREIVKEQDVYKRERLVNLRLFPYIMSKIWVAAILAIYASLVYMVIHYLVFDMPGGTIEFVLMFISLALATMAGMMLGLFASALAPNPNSAPLIVVLLMLPQIVLGGALVPLPTTVTAPISTRWAFQAFMGITGVGTDVAADECWQDEALIADMAGNVDADILAFKEAECNCMGAPALRQDSCSFPGVTEVYPPSHPVNQPPPPLMDEPDRPDNPKAPPEPVCEAEETDLAGQQRCKEDFQAWLDESRAVQAQFERDMAEFEAQLAIYEAQIAEFAKWSKDVSAAVIPREGKIDEFRTSFGWTFVNKDDPGAYNGMLVKTWAAQGIIIFVLFILIMILQKRKDVVK